MIDILNYFDLGFILAVILLTYTIIKAIDYLNRTRTVSKIIKRVILILSIAIIIGLYKLTGYDDGIKLVNSAVACPVVWSWLLKPICSKLGIDYKKINDVLS